MKRFLLILITVFSIGFFAVGQANAQTDEAKNSANAPKKSFVLLELYTSEGCPTCPPADANLARLEREQPIADTEIVTLALHVDYWNSLKWKDEYSSPIFSRRQQIYTQAFKTYSNYTPQMIVDGRTEFVGNNLAKARKTIGEAAKIQKATIEITASADKFKVKVTDVPAHQIATIFLAVTEDNLVSNRKYGAAADKRAAHVSVVRELKSLGLLAAEQSNLEIETVLQIHPDWTRENLKLVVFVQENASRKILGVSRIGLK